MINETDARQINSIAVEYVKDEADGRKKRLAKQTIFYSDGSETVYNYHKTQNADDRTPDVAPEVPIDVPPEIVPEVPFVEPVVVDELAAESLETIVAPVEQMPEEPLPVVEPV